MERYKLRTCPPSGAISRCDNWIDHGQVSQEGREKARHTVDDLMRFSDYLIPKSRLVRYKWCQVWGAVQKSVIELFPRFCESYGAEKPCGDGTADHQRFQ
ncbi:hypothetical protein J6590_093192 [Homalodisca vitripennis]|nr:hypothetical protein J6590_093192 [Homalodisca vitripennis]